MTSLWKYTITYDHLLNLFIEQNYDFIKTINQKSL